MQKVELYLSGTCRKKTTRWLLLLEDVECQMPPYDTQCKPADKQDRWCGQRHTHLISTSPSHTSVHSYTTRAHSSQSGDRGTFLRHQSVRQGLQSNDSANMTRHSAAMACLIHLMEKWNHTLNAWWSFLLPFLKGVYWTCWLEEVMARDKYGFLQQKQHDARDAEKMLKAACESPWLGPFLEFLCRDMPISALHRGD